MHCWSEMVINKKKQENCTHNNSIRQNNGSALGSSLICIYDSVHCSLQEFPLIYYQRVEAVSVFTCRYTEMIKAMKEHKGVMMLRKETKQDS